MTKVSVASTVEEPIDVIEVQDHLRIDSTSENPYISALISVARAQCENKTHRLLRPGTVTLTLDGFQAVELPYPPLRNSTALAITYIDSTGGTASVSSTVYDIHDDGDGPAVLTTAYGQSWPTPQSVRGAVTISYQAGYSTADPCPDALKHWMLLYVGGLYEHREAYVIGQSANLELPFLDGLLDPHVVHVVR